MIAKNKVVSLNYCLKDTQGEELERADADKPMKYIHGGGTIVSGLENALDGLKVGDKKEVTVKPEEGYGEIVSELRMKVERNKLPAGQEITVGMELTGEHGDGKKYAFHIVEIKGDDIYMDGNHPWAGKTVHFSVEVMEIRDATTEELKHGHVHGEGGHHH